MKTELPNDNLWARWLEGQLTPDEEAQIQAHPDYPLMQRIAESSAQWRMPALDDAAVATRWQALQAQKAAAQRPIRRLPVWKASLRVAALLCVLLGLGYWGLQQADRTYTTGAGQYQQLALPDGSQVVLSPSSSCHFNSIRWGWNREVTLQGEGFFTVKKGSTFATRTDLGSVTVLGTSFDVRTQGDQLEVSCYTGRVKIETPYIKKEISPGMTLLSSPQQQQCLKGLYPETGSLQRELHCTQQTLTALLERLERHYGLHLQYQGPVLKHRFTGIVPGDDAEKALRIICAAYQLNLQPKSNLQYVLTPVHG